MADYKLYYTNEVRDAIWELTDRHGISLGPELSLAEIIKRKNPNIVVFDSAQKMVDREGTFPDIIATLERDLGIPPQKAAELARDIKSTIVPLIDLVSEEPAEEPTDTDSERKEAFQKAKEDLLERIGARRKVEKAEGEIEEEPEMAPGVKNPETENVEANAKLMGDENMSERNAPTEEPLKPEAPKPADPYKESIS